MNAFDYNLEVKAIADDGEIEGLAISVGTLDEGKDIVAPGAVSRALAGRKSLPMLLFHDHKRPVGIWNSFRETSDGLEVKGRFSSSQAGREAREDARSGALGGLSMGFRTLRHKFEGKARHLLDFALDEISLVTVPMNRLTLVSSVKDITGVGGLPTLPEFEDALREVMGFSKSQAAAIAGKGLSHLLRGEPGSEPAAEYLAALGAQLRA
ncbi:HK97 family phage prohead protease [Sphingomonas sp. CFBP 8764]|uniref:HK97 family phage prohead protease n=1 Tax=Sphingomonas sp. CFBP 8764 TaxID=2775275 RepID=UPI00177DBA2E|nr:HK97 family phage prohead protease [Sphingomonas sp. CFBP 8764]MBD8549478.1 HK97 family phage prohead protease [Sphingomonas sp. CFBP 8764]